MALELLRNFGAEPVEERVVFDGRIVTAAGVSSGIDMALALAARVAGEETAQALQLAIEYDPQPPFDAGGRAKASPAVVDEATRILQSAALEASAPRLGPAPQGHVRTARESR
jgi:transcriptional regulator GlxA family with amidase domain